MLAIDICHVVWRDNFVIASGPVQWYCKVWIKSAGNKGKHNTTKYELAVYFLAYALQMTGSK